MIPDAAVEAAARAICMAHGEWSAYEWDQGIARDRMKVKYRDQARAALEAAAPHLIQNATADAWEWAADTIDTYSAPGDVADPKGITKWLRAIAAAERGDAK